MAKFTKLELSKRIKDAQTGEIVDIYRYIKEGTKRIYWAPEFNGERLNGRMHSTRWLAEDVAKAFLKRNK